MKRLRWQLLVVVLALVAIGFLLLGQQPTLLPGIVPVVEPAAGGVYTEALVGSFGRLNPVLDYYNQVDYDVDRLIFSSLVRFDSHGLPYGDLAQDWGISQDGTVYNFGIRPEAIWHDGQPVTSDDILFTIDLMRNEALPLPEDLREFWGQVEVIVLNEKTIQFRLPEPFAPFLDYLSFGVLPWHLLGSLSPEEIINSSFNLQPIGSGPYYYQSLDVTDDKITGVVLQAFDGYYGQRSFIDQVVFRYYPDVASAVAAYQQEDVMGISHVTDDVLQAALEEDGLNIFTGRLPRWGLVYLNLNSPDLPFFQDDQVRSALLMGLNRRWIVDRVLGGQAVIANGPIAPSSWAYYDGAEAVSYDPEGAVALLKEAGYTFPSEGGQVRSKDGVRLEFELAFPDVEPYPSIAQVVQENWLRLGVRVELKPVSYEELVNDYLEPRSYQAALADINLARSPDPDPYPFWHQTQAASGQNYSGWDDRQASEYLEQARVEVDLEERSRLYRNFQVRFMSQMPALPLYYPVYTFGISGQVQGASMGPLFDPSDRFANITSWFLVARRAAVLSTSAPVSTPVP